MASPSKENNVLKLILENSPLKEWHFKDIVKEAKVTKAVANKWIKKYMKEGLLKRNKEQGKFSYYKAGQNNAAYYSYKKIYALEQLHKSGLITELNTLKNIQTIIFFGSMIKGDWYKESDIDIFIFGNPKNFNKKVYENKLKRTIDVHFFENKQEIKKIKTGLIQNVINGYIIKGRLQDIVKVS